MDCITSDQSNSRSGITVVIPVYNRRHQIELTLRSLELQTRRPDEVILVDNGSTDGSEELLHRWSERKIEEGWKVRVLREDRRGAAAARQRGLDEVITEYVMFFDSDDLMRSDHIYRIMNDFENDASLEMRVWPVTFISENGKISRKRLLRGRIWENHLVQGLISTQAFASTTSLMRRVGGWNVELGGWDDWELGIRLLLQSPQIKVIEDYPVMVRLQEESMTGFDYWHRYGDWERTLDASESDIKKYWETLESGNLIAEPESISTQTTDVKDTQVPSEEKLLTMIAYRRLVLAAHYYREHHPAESELLRRIAFERLSSGLTTPICHAKRFILETSYQYVRRGLPYSGALFPTLLMR